ncbi:TIGR01777 family oxidoreductase [Aliarcobacter skirrowii]|uniref:TIGR01777 family oxidoreductase n=1 Tax=Aliarcobacter skirrowii TaxID=28200 RepID=UPI0029B6A1F2|nr:TIGR01777 family oxidoreductase [Aliarcobacter skirrowii]MDX4013187.1 TIGR01777 family oxidoreductase [Aliarcobacter skirrowii]
MKTITISGASGFVGQSLVDFFSNKNYKVVQIKREVLNSSSKLDELINSSDIIINLSGANIINRWSESYKKLLVSSRLETTKKLTESINRVTNKPKLFISTSAVGIYDNKNTYDENGSFSNDFLSTLCQNWEKEAQKAKNSTTKVAIFRFGIVLGKNGGAFKKMITPFRLGIGGIIGSGKQYFSYIHIEDLVSAYNFVIENEFDGVFNCTAPTPTTNYEFTKTLGKLLRRPTIFPIPEFVLKLIFSEGAKVLSDGQSAVPKRLLDLKFNIKYKNIEESLKSLV